MSERTTTAIIVALIAAYFVGFVGFRSKCRCYGKLCLVPETMVSARTGAPNLLFQLYKPVMFAEHQIDGRLFTSHLCADFFPH